MILISFLAILLTAFTSGCFRISADELYSLPEISEEHLRLQAHISMILNTGAEFAPPTGGPNRQAVQLMDLNGNGTNEVLAFFSVPGDSALKIYIFRMVDGDYTVAETIEGVGTEIESVRYVDMDGDGVMELVIGWQTGAALKYLSIYSIRDFHSELLVSGEEYTDISVFDVTGDGSDDVVVVRLPTQETGAIAVAYSLMKDGEIVTSEARLSSGIETIARILTGRLVDDIPAIFIESEGKFENGSLVTDVLAGQGGGFSNISLVAASGVSEDTVRHRMTSADINNDGIIKIPMLRLLKSQSETEYYAIDWYAFLSTGRSLLQLTTYHNNFDEWFLILPFDWRFNVSVRRDDAVPGERTIIFSYIAGEDGPYEDFLKVYRLSGEGAEIRASLDNRVLLLAEGNTAYAFEIVAPPNSFGLTFDEALVKSNFRLMYSDWTSGMSGN